MQPWNFSLPKGFRDMLVEEHDFMSIFFSANNVSQIVARPAPAYPSSSTLKVCTNAEYFVIQFNIYPLALVRFGLLRAFFALPFAPPRTRRTFRESDCN